VREVTTTVEMLNDIAQAVKRRDASELERIERFIASLQMPQNEADAWARLLDSVTRLVNKANFVSAIGQQLG